MRVLAIDAGSKRFGFAVGDTKLSVAFPLTTLDLGGRTPPEIYAEILKVVEQEEIEKILVGHPGSLRGAETPALKNYRELADNLEDFLRRQNQEITVELGDEVFSSEAAKKQLQELGGSAQDSKGKLDALAAAAFLQTYLEQQSGNAEMH